MLYCGIGLKAISTVHLSSLLRQQHGDKSIKRKADITQGEGLSLHNTSVHGNLLHSLISYPLIVADTPFQASYLINTLRSQSLKNDSHHEHDGQLQPPFRFVSLFDEAAYQSILSSTIPLSLGSHQVILIGGRSVGQGTFLIVLMGLVSLPYCELMSPCPRLQTIDANC